MDKTDLSLILRVLTLAIAVAVGLVACPLLAAFVAGLLIGQTPGRGR